LKQLAGKHITFKLEYIVTLLFFLPYLGTGIPAYIFALLYVSFNLGKLRFKWIDIFILSAVITWFCMKLMQSQLQATVILLRYYFGFYIFYLFFNSVNIKLNFGKLLLLISACVIAEAFLVNTIISPEILPNYPAVTENGAKYETRILGFYQRPYSIGTNASITSTIIIVLMFYIKAMGIKLNKLTKLAASGAIILLGSGVGYMLFFLYYLFLLRPFKNVIRSVISVSFVLLLYFLIFVSDIGATEGLEKISSMYLEFLYDFKTGQMEDVRYALHHAANGVLIGQQFHEPSELIIWSDFAWNDMYYCTGLLGIGLLVFILLIKFNRYNWVPFLIFIIGAIHYGAIFSLPGQLLLGYFFSLKGEVQALGEDRSYGGLQIAHT